jgi:hypothetical protein
VAGLAAFGAGEAIYELIPAKKFKINTMGTTAVGPTHETTRIADTRNAALTFGVLGLCLGGCLGMAGGLARRSTSAALSKSWASRLMARLMVTLETAAFVILVVRDANTTTFPGGRGAVRA